MLIVPKRKSSAKLYVDDVFSTYLYTGNGSTQTISNGIDLAGEGGLVWNKRRDTADDHHLVDTPRGITKNIYTNETAAEATVAGTLTAFNSDGFTLGSHGWWNGAGANYASWTFRKAPKFFDIVTWTGDSVAGRQIPHNLGVVPGMILVKCRTAPESWAAFHRSLGGTKYLRMDTAAAGTSHAYWSNTDPTAAVFTIDGIGGYAGVNAVGAQYIAYLFAHDPDPDGIIQCGSFTTDGSGNATVTLPWEPQFMLWKASSAVGNWAMFDTMRGWNQSASDAFVAPNLSSAESTSDYGTPTATGFEVKAAVSQTYVYLAIRRPNKPPKSGTEVYKPVAQNTGSPTTVMTGFPVDIILTGIREGTPSNFHLHDRLRGGSKRLITTTANAELDVGGNGGDFDQQQGVIYKGWGVGFPSIFHTFRRALGFFDVVCYTGTGVARTVPHGLGVAPELIIVKCRSIGSTPWLVYCKYLGAMPKQLALNTNGAVGAGDHFVTDPTDAVFSTNNYQTIGQGGATYVAYLFASLPGISKIGSYTGNGTSQTINCGFATGARFVLIKRTDAAGDWFVWDTARGIVAANDPHLSLNTTAAEVTTDDSLDPDPSGFIVNQVAATNINVSGASFIFLAIA